MVADDVVGLAHHPAGADSDRLLPDAAVRGADDGALAEELRGAVLEVPDERHQAVLLDQRWAVGGTRGVHGGLDAHRVNVRAR